MASPLRLLCFVFGLLAVQELPGAEGVYFSLDPVETKDDGQTTCGVLHCRDEVKPGSASIISSLTVYKLDASRRVTLTTLSREKHIDNGTLDGIDVYGMWTPGKAEVTLSLTEKDDCTQVKFSCQVRFTDGQGKERMSSAIVGGEGGEGLTTSEQADDTPSPGSDRKSSVMSRGVRSVKDGTCSVACEDKLKTMIRSVKEEVELVKRRVQSDKWVVIQRRSRGDVDFYRNWDTYKKGFGSPDGDFWLGNNRIHALTSGARYELRITLGYNGIIYYANYDSFSIGGENDNYRLNLGKYSGSAGDSLSLHRNKMFSTFDRDNDECVTNLNCAEWFTGAWWYNCCQGSNLNGKWGASRHKGPRWSTIIGADPATFTEMKIREVIV